MIDTPQFGGLTVEAKRDLLKTLLSLRDGPTTGIYPLSPGQQALWFTYQLAPASPAYNFLFASRLPGATDLDALTKAFQGLIRRHPALRTRFFLKDGKPTQKVEAELPLELPRVDAQEWTWEQLLVHLQTRADAPFDLERGPAMRAEFYRRADETVLLLVFHHIVADLWSMDLLIGELKDLYRVQANPNAPANGAPRASFADYLKHHLTNLHGPRGQKALAYWLQELSGTLPVLDLPTDRPRPATQSYRGATYTWPIAGETGVRLRSLASQLGATLFPIVLATFELLIHRYSGQSDLLVGVTTADRGKPEWERLVGYFLNQIVLRARLQPGMTFLDLVGQVREKLMHGLEHHEYPFGELVKKLQPQRDPSRSPVFQTMFIWDRPRAMTFPVGGDSRKPVASVPGRLTMEPVLLEQRGAPCDLTFIVFEGETLTARFCYNTDLFDRSTIERMARHLDTLLGTLAESPTTPLGDVPMLSPTERTILLDAWGQPPPLEPLADDWLTVFEGHARQTPDAIALEQEERQLTYGELNAQANRLARRLEGEGVKVGDVVAIHAPRCPEAVVAVLAAWKLRAAWTYLDPNYPAHRLAVMITDAQPAVVLTATEAPANVKAIRFEDAGTAALAGDNLDRVPTPSDWAYVIYTSGSTGTPKGTVLTRRGLIPLASAQRQFLRVTPQDRVLLFASLSFDASVYEMLLGLTAGARLVLPTATSVLPGPGLAALLRDKAVSVVTLPPSILQAVPAGKYPDLRLITVAGEACPAELVTRWANGRRLINAYGPTEATVCATWTECVADGTGPAIGRPMAATRVYVVDANLQLTPVGVPGELLLGGPGLAVGYLNQPGLTAERLLQDPFRSGNVVYRTGDLVRWRADGQIEFLGRLDHQVKLRGHRIELDEVQEVLRQHAAIADAGVILREDAGKGPALAAYVVGRNGEEVPLDSVREHLRARLPAYALPATITVLPELPRSGYGKIDRKALARITPRVQGSSRHVPARTDAEKTLAQIWGRVLGLDKVSIHDNFFDLGGASMQTVEVVALAEQAGLALTPESVFRHQTIAELAEVCGASAAGGSKVSPTETPVARARGLSGPGAVIESLGVYLPPKVLTTDEVLKGCKAPLDFPLERFTGIKSRRVAGEEEFSIDLARKALTQCLARSKYGPLDVDLLICCNISRYDGPFFRFSLEPTTAARLQQEFGLLNALAFDVTNACAGTFTAISLADAMLRQGLVRNALIVTGEYITHLTQTAQMEIEDFMDPRMACLTLGDAGQAILLERAPNAEVGFHDLELFTLGKYHGLCVAKLSRNTHGGAIMHTDPVKSAVVTTKLAVGHCLEVLGRNQWMPEAVRQVIMHQTSERTLDGAVQEINRVLGKTAVDRRNTVYNLAERGNCATNTHLLAVWENIQAGKIQPGDRVLFAVSGSGLVVGTAIYTFDDLPERLRSGMESAKRQARTLNPLKCFKLTTPARIESISVPAQPGDSTTMLRAAGEDCLARSQKPRNEIDLILHTGVYHSDFLSEPALATIAAGELGINHDDESNFARRTFGFDVLNGGVGTLTACFLAAMQMQTGRVQRALILASEVENNATDWPEHLLGVRPMATAFVLEPGEEEGFVAFGFRGFPEYLEKRASWTGAHDYKPAAFHQSDKDLDEVYLTCIQTTVTAFLREQGLTLAAVDCVLSPWRSPAFTREVGRRLGVADKVVTMTEEGDLFTSSLACGFAQAREQGRLRGLVLVIEVGAGVQVGCALYRAAAQESNVMRSEPHQPGAQATGSHSPSLALRAGTALGKTIDFSLMFFGSDEGSAARDKYEMVLDAARFADDHGLAAVWVPERHFTAMGSLYPNPAVLHAAIARETKRLRLRAGSVVLPLHNPIRVAEEWAVVDNLSNGRVELSFAPGWNPGDFALAPDRYASRYDLLYAGLQQFQRLWAGEPIDATDGEGKAVRVRTYPTPVQKHLTIWITAAGSEKSFQQAGTVGANLLTHLFDQDVEGLAKKLSLYRQARAQAGHDLATGRVCVALHTFLADTLEQVKEQVRGPYAEYLKSNLGLLEKLAASRGVPIDLKRLQGNELAMAIEWLFEKFISQRSLMGTPDTCAELVEKLQAIDVQEIACLVDFGPSAQAILNSLPSLARLAERFRHVS